jgi:hypothetical protein
MDLSTRSPRAKLSEKGKNHQRREGKCLYCGGNGHLAITCPLKKGVTRPFAALTAAPPKTSESKNDLSLSQVADRDS